MCAFSFEQLYRLHSFATQIPGFHIELLYLDDVVASHPRCFEKERGILDPLHYLPLLSQRPGAFEHAKPLRHWRKKWSKSYEHLLQELRESKPDGRGMRECLEILQLHQAHPEQLVAQAIEMALDLGATHLVGR